MRRVVVIGAGVAGLAAAWSARKAGANVALVDGGVGATALASGAIDDVPWERALTASRVLGVPLASRPLPDGVAAFAEALGLWALPKPAAPPSLVVTTAGRLRPARGHDRALLDVGQLADTVVLVPRAARPGWDAGAIAAALCADPLARARRLDFVAVDARLLRFDDEQRCSDADLAARHDDSARLGWLADALRTAITRANVAPGAILLGPWLGVVEPRGPAMATRMQMPVGEALAGVGSPAGLRFEAARRRLVDAAGIAMVRARATRVAPNGSGAVVAFEGERDRSADAIVVAIGGVAGGGVVYDPPDHAAGADLPRGVRVPFRLSLDAPEEIVLGTEPVGIVSSMHGPDLDAVAWPDGARDGALELVGVAPRRTAAPLFWAGDVVASRPRTMLEAVASGIAAGRAAAG